MTPSTDQELFELCKEVYKRTGWIDPDSRKGFVNPEDPEGRPIPLYTSDYLLEKLPGLIGVTMVHMDDVHTEIRELRPGESLAGATYQSNIKGIMRGAGADTPLKAVLKLVIALDDAGVKL